MQKVNSVHLGQGTFLMDEASYDALVNYLNKAKRELKDNPDFGEINNDIECAIAEKLSGTIKNETDPVKFEDLELILEKMGPVKSPNENEAGLSSEEDEKSTDRRFYQIPEGAIITGLCKGLGTYLAIDPLLIRGLFVLLALVTSGWGVLVYLLLALVVPFADTKEKQSEAQGKPYNAQTMVDQAKENYERLTKDPSFRNRWSQQVSEIRKRILVVFGDLSSSEGRGKSNDRQGIAASLFAVLLGFLSMGLLLGLMYSIFTIMTENQIFGYVLPSTYPIWSVVLGLVIVFILINTPLESLRRSLQRLRSPRADGRQVIQTLLLLGIGVLLYSYVPDVRNTIMSLPGIIESTIDAIRAGKGF